MMTVRPFRETELAAILQRGAQTAREQVVGREAPGATSESVERQLYLMYQNALMMPGATILVADWPAGLSGQGPAGYVLLMPQANAFTGERELIVLDIFTHPALRGQRVGRMLLMRAEEYARSAGCKSMVAQVALHNASSLRLFQGSDYQQERLVVGKRLR